MQGAAGFTSHFSFSWRKRREQQKKWSKRRVNHGQSECGWLIGLAFASITALYTPMTQPGWQAVTHLLIDSCSLFTQCLFVSSSFSQLIFSLSFSFSLSLSLSLFSLPGQANINTGIWLLKLPLKASRTEFLWISVHTERKRESKFCLEFGQTNSTRSGKNFSVREKESNSVFMVHVTLSQLIGYSYLCDGDECVLHGLAIPNDENV